MKNECMCDHHMEEHLSELRMQDEALFLCIILYVFNVLIKSIFEILSLMNSSSLLVINDGGLKTIPSGSPVILALDRCEYGTCPCGSPTVNAITYLRTINK